MRKHRLVAVGATLLAATMAFSACGSRAEQGGNTGQASTKVAKIGVIAPLSGDLSALGLGIRNSVDLAIRQANEKNLIPAIEIARARFAEIKAVEAEVEDLTERLESRKAVDRAKGMLQTGLGLTEPEAFRWIQKTAMDLHKSMREVAEGVIEHGAGAKRR